MSAVSRRRPGRRGHSRPLPLDTAAPRSTTPAAEKGSWFRDGHFTTGDKVDLSAIDANGSGAGNTAFTFISGEFSGTAGELRVTPAANGFQLVTGDINGDRVADFAIAVLSDHVLTAADFVL